MKLTYPARASLALCVLASACSHGSKTASAAAADQTLDPYTAPLTEADARFFLQRACLGADPKELAKLETLGLHEYLARALEFAVDTPVERAAEAVIQDPNRPRTDELARWWLFLMVRTESPLQEALALFWHDHFATSQLVLSEATKRYMVQHVNMLRRLAAGNLKELVHRVANDPAMLVFLDGVSSTKNRPNLNFPREFFEVFTLGRNNGYTEADIREASRAFTGWRMVEDRATGDVLFVWDPSRHDLGQKTVFGETGSFGYRELVELTFRTRGVAEYIAARLFEHFCGYAPGPGLVAQMAKRLRDNDYELKPLLRALLGSRAFFSAQSRAPIVKSPLEYVVGFSRTTGLELPFPDLYEHLLTLRHVPTQAPSVFGWPTGSAWVGEHAMVQRGSLLNELITAREHNGRLGRSLTQLLPPLEQRTADSVVATLADSLGVTLTLAERQLYVDYLNQQASGSASTYRVERSPFDASNGRHVDERVRGLLFILSQHPSYHTR